NGLRRTAPTPWARLPLPLLFGLDHGRHLCSEARQPELHEVCGLPRRVREEPAHAGQTRTVRDLAQQARRGPRFVAQEQAQQHGHDVLILRLAQTGAERLHPLAHTGIEAYNRDRHGGLLATRVAEHPLATRPRCYASTPPPKTAKIEIFTFLAVNLEFLLGLGIAALMARSLRRQSIKRSLIMAPMMFAPVLVGFQFQWFFNQN